MRGVPRRRAAATLRGDKLGVSGIGSGKPTGFRWSRPRKSPAGDPGHAVAAMVAG